MFSFHLSLFSWSYHKHAYVSHPWLPQCRQTKRHQSSFIVQVVMMVYSISGLFLTNSWMAYFQNNLSCWHTGQKEQISFLGSRPTMQFFSDPHVADHFLISFLGSLLPCGVAPTAPAGQYLWNLPGSETVSVWLLPLSPTVQCEWRPLFNSSAAASHGHQHQILPSPGLQGSPRELPFLVLSWTSIPVLWPTRKCACTY